MAPEVVGKSVALVLPATVAMPLRSTTRALMEVKAKMGMQWLPPRQLRTTPPKRVE